MQRICFLLMIVGLMGCDTAAFRQPEQKVKIWIGGFGQSYQIDPTETCGGHDKQDCLGYTYDKADELYPGLAKRLEDAKTLLATRGETIDAKRFVDELEETKGYSAEFKAAMVAHATDKSRKDYIDELGS